MPRLRPAIKAGLTSFIEAVEASMRQLVRVKLRSFACTVDIVSRRYRRFLFLYVDPWHDFVRETDCCIVVGILLQIRSRRFDQLTA
jgi:hypothetical protein